MTSRSDEKFRFFSSDIEFVRRFFSLRLIGLSNRKASLAMIFYLSSDYSGVTKKKSQLNETKKKKRRKTVGTEREKKRNDMHVDDKRSKEKKILLLRRYCMH